MTRTEAIAIIEKALPSADEQTLAAAAALFQSSSSRTSGLPRTLSEREGSLLAQSKADFAADRSYSLEESIAILDERLAPLGVPKSTA